MTSSERRANMKTQMAQRAQESYNSKDDSGKFKSYLVKDKMGKIGMWKVTEDEHFIDIIPFIAGKRHPSVAEGQEAYLLDVFVHRKVGVNEDSYVCMARTYKEACPICEYQAMELKKESYDKDFIKSLNPTRRAIYNVVCQDSDKEIAKGVQLLDVSHYLFEKEVIEIARKPRGGGFVTFADLDDGKTLFFRKSGSGATNTEFKGFAFEDRTAPISEEIEMAALCLDELLYIPTYAEVKAAFFGNSVEEDSEVAVTEKAIEAEESRRTRRVPAEEAVPAPVVAPTPAPTDEGCPGTPPEDYGTLAECDACPDAEECLAEFTKLEEAKAAEEAAKAAAPVAEAPRRSRLGTAAPAATPAAATPAPAAAPAAATPATEGRIRRRPGQA